MKPILAILIALFLTACGTQTPPPTPSAAPTPSPSPEATKTPAVTPTPEGPKDGDTYTVTENGHTYEYVYNAELGTGVRDVGDLSLLDYPYEKFFPYKISITKGTQGELSLVSIIHKDPGSEVKTTPIKGVLVTKLVDRYTFPDINIQSLPNGLEKKVAFREELLKGAEFPIIISGTDGKPENKIVVISEDTGINLTIMDLDTMLTLGGENVIELHNQNTDDGKNYTFYVEVYGVDLQGNELVRLAFDRSIAEIPDKVLREILFSIPGNFADHVDQRKQGFTSFAQLLAQKSEEMQADGITQDVIIERVRASSITPTPTPTP